MGAILAVTWGQGTFRVSSARGPQLCVVCAVWAGFGSQPPHGWRAGDLGPSGHKSPLPPLRLSFPCRQQALEGQLSLCPTVSMSHCPHVLLSPCPTVPIPRCPHVPMFCCPGAMLSICPSPQDQPPAQAAAGAVQSRFCFSTRNLLAGHPGETRGLFFQSNLIVPLFIIQTNTNSPGACRG